MSILSVTQSIRSESSWLQTAIYWVMAFLLLILYSYVILNIFHTCFIMLIVKLVVLFVLIFVPILTSASYCEICLNHTLCRYPVSFIMWFVYKTNLMADVAHVTVESYTLAAAQIYNILEILDSIVKL